MLPIVTKEKLMLLQKFPYTIYNFPYPGSEKHTH